MTDPAKQPPKRETWPIAIGVVLVVFVLAVVGFGLFSITQRNDLVVRDYYDAGLEYQKQVESEERASEGGAPLTVAQLKSPRGVRLTFAERFRNRPLDGSIRLYRPSNAGFDKSFELALDGDARQLVPMEKLPPGYWKVKVVWTLDGEEYYHEEGFVLE